MSRRETPWARFATNVLIYFDGESKRKAVQHFHDNLLPHGYLFLGNTESLYGNDQFRLIHLPSTTAYIKADRAQGGK
jgi:chemotaxis protein methyltransferase CheR